jgi:hypothetical protein
MNLDREDFRQWLVSKEPDEVVGVRRSLGDCPAVRYGADCGLSYQQVYNLSRTGGISGWLNTFMLGVDRNNEWMLPRKPITAKEALTILDSLETG